MADTKVSALSELSAPTLDDLLYIVDDPGATPVSNKITLNRLLGFGLRSLVNGRLTLETAVPVSTSDQTGKTTIYFTPYQGNLLSVFDGTRWRLYTFTELSLALGTLTSGANYDVFVYDNAGTLTLELSAAWTSDTVRNQALTLQDGRYVKSGATTRLYLGTFRTTSTTATEDSRAKRFVWNAHNRVHRNMFVADATSSWSATINGYRQANAAAGNQLALVVGLQEETAHISVVGVANSALGVANQAIGYDSTTTPHADCIYSRSGATAVRLPHTATLVHQTGIGYHTYVWLEGSNNNSTAFLGTDICQCGITGRIQM